jgi:hypothetical protein
MGNRKVFRCFSKPSWAQSSAGPPLPFSFSYFPFTRPTHLPDQLFLRVAHSASTNQTQTSPGNPTRVKALQTGSDFEFFMEKFSPLDLIFKCHDFEMDFN